MGFRLSYSKGESDAGWLVPKMASVLTLIHINLVDFAHTKKLRPCVILSRMNPNKSPVLIESSNSAKNPEAQKMECHTYSTRQGSLKSRERNGV